MKLYNKQGRLALLLPRQANHDGALYTVEELDDEGEALGWIHPKSFWDQLAAKPESLIPNRNRELQVRELRTLLTQFQLNGPQRPPRREGNKSLGCVALPYEDNHNRKRMMKRQGLSAAEVEELVLNVPVIRLYAFPIRNSLVLFDGGVKTSNRWQDSDDVRAKAEEGNAIADVLDQMIRKESLAFTPQGFLDLDYCEDVRW